MNCHFCKTNPTISNSHVVPRFVVNFIKENSATNFLLNSWVRNPVQDGLKGPYLCKQCDNVLFSSWENFFKKEVFDIINQPSAKWTDLNSLRFLLSIIFRYSIHFLETSPIQANHENNRRFRDLAQAGIHNPANIGTNLYLYIYIYKPVEQTCDLLVGINHLLNCSFHAVSLPAEPNLPNGFLFWLPSLIMLATDDDLSIYKGNEIKNIEALSPNKNINYHDHNNDMPIFLKDIFNRIINEGQSHQKNLGRWTKLYAKIDRKIHPEKIIYKATDSDGRLNQWQNKNCRRNSVH